jgi:hypothetical protein
MTKYKFHILIAIEITKERLSSNGD